MGTLFTRGKIIPTSGGIVCPLPRRQSQPPLQLNRTTKSRWLALLMAVASAFCVFFVNSAAGQTPCLPVVWDVVPDFATTGHVVTIEGCKLDKVSDVLFGVTKAKFHIDSSQSITAEVPWGTPGSTVPVTAIADLPAYVHTCNGRPCQTTPGPQTIPSTATFSYPIGEFDVTGPLPHYYDENGDFSWYNGHGHQLSFENPGGLVFGTEPVFHIKTVFNDDSSIYPEGTRPDPNRPSINLGDGAKYSATLERCSLSETNGDGPCTNYDHQMGQWVRVTSQTGTLTTIGGGLTAVGDLVLQTGGLFSAQQLVNTVRIRGDLGQTDSRNHVAEGDRIASADSSAFDVALVPAALVQLSVIPYTILYQPPGDLSTVSFTTKSGFGTRFTLGNSNQQSNSYTYESSSSTQGSLNLAFMYGFKYTNAEAQDNDVKMGFGLTDDTASQQGDTLAITTTRQLGPEYSLTPGDGTTCASATDCSQNKLNSPPAFDMYMNEPFWNDTFVLLVHPQFAVYVLGEDVRYVMTASVPITADITVRDLEACRLGETPYGLQPCEIPYSDTGFSYRDGTGVNYTGEAHSITLTARDAANLLALDPFYGYGQNATLPAARAIPIGGSVAYGAKIQEGPAPFSKSVDNTMAKTETHGEQETTYTSITDIFTSSTGGGVTLDLKGSSSASYSESYTLGEGDKRISDNDIRTTYSDSTATSSQLETTANVTLNDVDNTTPGPNGLMCSTCHHPLPYRPSATIFLDRLFGGFMFQDPRAPTIPAYFTRPTQLYKRSLATAVAVHLTTRAKMETRFGDVSPRSPVRVAIGVLTLTGVMSGYPDKRFRPDAPLTRAELASALSRAVQLQPDRALTLLFTAARNPKTPVTEEMISVALARAFALRPSEARRYVGLAYSGRRFYRYKVVTRAEAARILFAVLQERCVESCTYTRPTAK